MATITFDKSKRYIEIDIADTSVTIQELINAIRDFEDEQFTMDFTSLANASGKQALGGGILVGITLELLDNWRVHFADRPGAATIACSITGGNLVTTNDYSNNPVAPSTFVTVTITASSSATLQELNTILQASYNNGVIIDVTSIYTGITHPVGTSEQPVNNINDAQSIARTRGFKKLTIMGNMVMSSSYSLSGYEIHGESPSDSFIEIEPGCNTTGSIFKNTDLSGSFSGRGTWLDSHLQDSTGIEGNIHNCLFEKDIWFAESASVNIIDCWSGAAGSEHPHFYSNGYLTMTVRQYAGGFGFAGLTGGNVSMDINGGHVHLHSTILGGTIIVRGNAKLTNEATGSSGTVETEYLVNPYIIADRQWLHETGSFINKATALIPAIV